MKYAEDKTKDANEDAADVGEANDANGKGEMPSLLVLKTPAQSKADN